MKSKISVLIFEADERFSPLDSGYLRLLVDESFQVPSKYISTKQIDTTIQELYSQYCHLDVRYANPILSDVRLHNSEVEILYRTIIPHGVVGIKRGHLLPPHSLELDSFYETAILEQPRSLSQRY
tara:strand:+ start:8637 stop:9011 length:375 start_codon:yes stop_codon:yes gene_type:complete